MRRGATQPERLRGGAGLDLARDTQDVAVDHACRDPPAAPAEIPKAICEPSGEKLHAWLTRASPRSHPQPTSAAAGR